MPTPTPTPVWSPTTKFQYRVDKASCTHRCGTTGIEGAVYDANSDPVPDLWVRASTDDWCCGWARTNVDGTYVMLLASDPRSGHWYVALYGTDQSTQLSGVVETDTVSGPCELASGGCQWSTVDFAENTDFVVVQERILPKVGDKCSPEHYLDIQVIDARGNLLDGINVQITGPGGETNVVSGENGPGRIMFTMFGSYQGKVEGDESGRQYTSERTRVLDSMNATLEDLIAGGYCKGMSTQECVEQRDLGPSHLCYGHYSYEVVFQRQ